MLVLGDTVDKEIEELQDYFYDTLHIQLKAKPWKGQGELPFFLVDLYTFYEAELLDQACVFMIGKANAELTPAAIKKHWEQIQQKFGGLCILIQQGVSAYNRTRLIGHHVPFIVPGNQMYLPDLGIDLREHFRKLRSSSLKSFSPATQAVLINALIHGIDERFTPSELAKKLKYTTMTMTRAFDELQAADIGEVKHMGRERWWLFAGNRRELWKQARPLMRTPVKYKRWLSQKPKSIDGIVRTAGLSALSCLSMINAPDLPVFAVGLDKWDTLQSLGLEEVPMLEGAVCELEIWNYEPSLFAMDKIVDPFSLYLSLITDADERVELAIEEMMEKIEW